MDNAIEKQQSSTPGFGVAGMVMCPFFKNMCMKQGCELWVELSYTENKVARCSLAWLAILSTETRQAIDKLNGKTPDRTKV